MAGACAAAARREEARRERRRRVEEERERTLAKWREDKLAALQAAEAARQREAQQKALRARAEAEERDRQRAELAVRSPLISVDLPRSVPIAMIGLALSLVDPPSMSAQDYARQKRAEAAALAAVKRRQRRDASFEQSAQRQVGSSDPRPRGASHP